jgi:hypothetical protein
MDIIAIIIYAIDMLVVQNTGTANEFEEIESNKQVLRRSYLNNGLILDILATVPVDYLGYGLGATLWSRCVFRLFRLLKLVRVYRIIKVIGPKLKGIFIAYDLTLYLVLYIYLNHFAACGMFLVGKLQLEEDPNARFDNRTWMLVFGELPYHDYEPILDMTMIEQYIHCLYWAYAT